MRGQQAPLGGLAGTFLLRIADLLLDFTRARLGGGIPVSRRPGDLNELCRKVADELKAARPERLLLCEFAHGELQGEWDLDRLAQVFSNLLDNACKYSLENTPVRLFTANDIARAHGSCITVESTAEAGTTFRVCLSRHAPQAGRPSPCDVGQTAALSRTA